MHALHPVRKRTVKQLQVRPRESLILGSHQIMVP
jgi:hypothetical protein